MRDSPQRATLARHLAVDPRSELLLVEELLGRAGEHRGEGEVPVDELLGVLCGEVEGAVLGETASENARPVSQGRASARKREQAGSASKREEARAGARKATEVRREGGEENASSP